ncbi:DUF481 domain-containing protein [Alkalimonas sp. MEB108]|uniref:DUF481 domain-containing protein n=1 Tax=Alkalimonas cellulosilytica TaxID=3058395 RepID=A0ABU7J1M7_9GAMM|nr:DUF481 domain-containing protein [Alkalimonas sp. MEB108]MEE1999932.1 DUF481 domain-containing protein [Alkalimonas sp. MEB108]
MIAVRNVALVAACVCCAYFNMAYAATDLTQAEQAMLQPKLGGDVELGLLYSSGNTKATSVRLNSELVHEIPYFRNRYQVQGLTRTSKVRNADDDGYNRVTSGQRIGLTGQSNYKFAASNQSGFGRAAYLNDRFGAFREQASVALGYANRVFDQSPSYLDLETGPGVGYQRRQNGDSEGGLIWFAAANLEYKVYQGTRFRQALETILSLDGESSSVLSRSSLTAQLNGRLSMRFNFIVKYDSKPDPGRFKTDTETSASVVYSF